LGRTQWSYEDVDVVNQRHIWMAGDFGRTKHAPDYLMLSRCASVFRSHT